MYTKSILPLTFCMLSLLHFMVVIVYWSRRPPMTYSGISAGYSRYRRTLNNFHGARQFTQIGHQSSARGYFPDSFRKTHFQPQEYSKPLLGKPKYVSDRLPESLSKPTPNLSPSLLSSNIRVTKQYSTDSRDTATTETHEIRIKTPLNDDILTIKPHAEHNTQTQYPASVTNTNDVQSVNTNTMNGIDANNNSNIRINTTDTVNNNRVHFKFDDSKNHNKYDGDDDNEMNIDYHSNHNKNNKGITGDGENMNDNEKINTNKSINNIGNNKIDTNHTFIDNDIISNDENFITSTSDFSKLSAGFPGKRIPDHILQWRPSSDSYLHFRPIEDKEAWLYSAYYDNADKTDIVVRAFGIVKTTGPRRIVCHYLDSSKQTTESQFGRIVPIRDKSMFEYLSTSFVCPLASDSQRPHYLSITFYDGTMKRLKGTPPNPLSVQYPGSGFVRNFTVCFSPFHSNYNTTYQLIQSLVLNQILGAEYFIFYNFSISPLTNDILRHYSDKGLATILQWPLPVMGTWYYGQLAAINDCIYRNRMTSRFVVVIDTDEFIIPNKHRDWWDMINDLISSNSFWENDSYPPRKSVVSVSYIKNYFKTANATNVRDEKRVPPYIGGFSFRNVLYPSCIDPNRKEHIDIFKSNNFTSKELSHIQVHSNSVVAQLQHSEEMMEHERRSKLIVRPECVHHASIHKMMGYKNNYGVVYVNTHTAWLHHHHTAHNPHMCQVWDVSILKYKTKLLDRLQIALEPWLPS